MRFFIAVLAVIGMALATAALREHYNTKPSPCDINTKWDCGIVNKSQFAMIHGIPVAAIGIVGYLAMAALALSRSRRLLLATALIGLGFSLYLTHIEASVLEVWCIYCVGSLITISLINLSSIGWFAYWWRHREQE